MICYDKYGKMTPEFSKYQQSAWDRVRLVAEEITAQAIRDGVCPQAVLGTMTAAVNCGSVLASQQAYVDDHIKLRTERPEGWHMGLVKGL
ncbi:hypothetical protein POP15_152 [Pectobacterium phage POP15]|nr:hypothetical protein POP15_152 [Pectobacterium phage POP15]